MYESRCGASCSSCEKKEKFDCKGCLNMSQPYWGGHCGVKYCCERKEIEHCGKCELFPCEMLSTMGDDYGFDPFTKLEMCRKWASED